MKNATFAILLMGTFTGIQSAEAVKVMCPKNITKQTLHNGKFLYSGQAVSKDKNLRFPFAFQEVYDVSPKDLVFDRVAQDRDTGDLRCLYEDPQTFDKIVLVATVTNRKCVMAGKKTYFECESDDQQKKEITMSFAMLLMAGISLPHRRGPALSFPQ